MKRPKVEPLGARRFKLSHLLIGIGTLYLVFISFKFPKLLEVASMLSGDDSYSDVIRMSSGDMEDADVSKPFVGSVYKDTFHRKLEDNQNQKVPSMPLKEPLEEGKGKLTPIKPLQHKYGRVTGKIMERKNRSSDLSMLERMADEAWILGLKAWVELNSDSDEDVGQSSLIEGKQESCPSWVSVSGDGLNRNENTMFLPCGLAAGSSITVVATPHYAHKEYVPQLARLRNGNAIVLVSQFMVELQGLKVVDGEDPPKILHFNPRLRGDWSQKPVIEHNTCYRMKWGKAQRCDGLPSNKDDDVLGAGQQRILLKKFARKWDYSSLSVCLCDYMRFLSLALAKAKKALQAQKELAEKLKKIPLLNKGASTRQPLYRTKGGDQTPSLGTGRLPLHVSSASTVTASMQVEPSATTLPTVAFCEAIYGWHGWSAVLTNILNIEAVKRTQVLATKMGFHHNPEFAPRVN
ncbi:Galectin, carbohydrate recognition domain, partial [Dillenia turbinata]